MEPSYECRLPNKAKNHATMNDDYHSHPMTTSLIFFLLLELVPVVVHKGS
jgi:hypothetical protein